MSAAPAESATIDLSVLKLEIAVERAFDFATGWARDRPVTAVDLLRAALALREGSKAFQHLAELLGMDEPLILPGSKPTLTVTVTDPVAKSFEIARKIIGTEVMRGRDYVAMALLADDHPLDDLTARPDVTRLSLRDEWFRFAIQSDDPRHNRAYWEAWWNAAGVPLPTDESEPSGPVEKSALVDTPAPAPAYLIRHRGETKTDLSRNLSKLKSSGAVEMLLGIGNLLNLEDGARAYLYRNGLIGVGEVIGPVVEPPKRMDKSVRVRLRALSPEPFVTVDELIAATGEEKLWGSTKTCVPISPEIAARLDALVRETYPNLLPAPEPSDAPTPEPGGDPTAEPSDAMPYARTLSDLDHSKDWIGIDSDVDALSTLVAVNKVEPPLSIAIFGDWGSGKTFLMRKMQDRIKLLEKVGIDQQADRVDEAKQPDQENAPPRYCSSILQIEFNAWHYMESNLWASLVNHIFEKLHDRLVSSVPDASDKTEEQREKKIEPLFEEFTTAQAAKQELEAKAKRVTAEVKQTERTAKAAGWRLRRAQGKLAHAMGRSAWSALKEKVTAKDNDYERNLAEAREALEHFGFSTNPSLGGSADSLQTIYDTVLRFRSASGRSREILGSMLSTWQGGVGAVLVALGTLGAVALAYHYNAAILGVGGALVSALAWVAERAASAQPWLNRLQRFDDILTKLKDQADGELAEEIARAQAVFDEKKENLAAVQQQLREAQAREANAKANLKNLTARELIRSFVDGRVTAGTYANHLGLVSMIRQDFEYLSRTMSSATKTDQVQLLQRVETTTGETIPRVERIILYIDDLDRCQPDRVVEVLEAVHLLLSFRLFIVVVAVDPRWVLQSLQDSYPYLADTVVENGRLKDAMDDQSRDSAKSSNNRASATTHDFIEKIFNIPFWVQRMSPEASERLIAGYLDLPKKAGSKTPNDSGSADQQSDGHAAEPQPTPIETTVADLPESREPKPDPAEQPVTPTSHPTEERTKQDPIAAMQQLENVSIGENEAILIRKLARYLGNSPRRIKRFANTYRLFKAGMDPDKDAGFTSRVNGTEDYRIVLVFLSILTGAPNIAPDIFARVFDGRANLDLDRLVTEIQDAWSATAPVETANAVGALKLLADSRLTEGQIDRWLKRVKRFAFRPIPVDATSPPPS